MRKEMKKLIGIAAVGALALSLAACGSKSSAYVEEDWSEIEWDSEWDDSDWGSEVADDDYGTAEDEKTEWEINQEKESMVESYWVLDDTISPVGGDYTFYTDGSYMFSGGGGETTYGTYEYTDKGINTHSESGYDHEWTANDAWDTLTSDEGDVLYLRDH